MGGPGIAPGPSPDANYDSGPDGGPMNETPAARGPATVATIRPNASAAS
jgi:hypothetical protein